MSHTRRWLLGLGLVGLAKAQVPPTASTGGAAISFRPVAIPTTPLITLQQDVWSFPTPPTQPYRFVLAQAPAPGTAFQAFLNGELLTMGPDYVLQGQSLVLDPTTILVVTEPFNLQLFYWYLVS